MAFVEQDTCSLLICERLRKEYGGDKKQLSQLFSWKNTVIDESKTKL